MKAIGFFEFGGPEVLKFVDVPRPEPRPRDVVVRVKAVSVNPVDSKVRRGVRGGTLLPGSATVPGWDAAGVVEAAGSEARRFKPGDEVFFAGEITRPGSYAEFAACDERIAGRKPRSLSFEEAAAVPLVAITAWESLVECLGVGEGQGAGRTVLIVGGAGGVGSMATQVAKRVLGLRVIATVSRPESAAWCREMGADRVVDHAGDLAAQVPEGAEFVLSCAEKPDWKALSTILKPFGRICSILPAVGADLGGIFMKRGTVAFEVMFARAMHGVEPERQGAILDRVADFLDRKVLRSPVTKVLDWKDVRAAHEAIDTAHTLGKLVLRVSGQDPR